jgi:hypothetical protein
MGDARKLGGPSCGCAGPSGGNRPRTRGEDWLERMVSGLYRSAVDEPVPRELLDLVKQIGRSESSASEALARARRWRAKAEECRAAAESMSTGAARSSFLQLARNYEGLAQHAEREARPQRDGAGNRLIADAD